MICANIASASCPINPMPNAIAAAAAAAEFYAEPRPLSEPTAVYITQSKLLPFLIVYARPGEIVQSRTYQSRIDGHAETRVRPSATGVRDCRLKRSSCSTIEYSICPLRASALSCCGRACGGLGLSHFVDWTSNIPAKNEISVPLKLPCPRGCQRRTKGRRKRHSNAGHEEKGLVFILMRIVIRILTEVSHLFTHADFWSLSEWLNARANLRVQGRSGNMEDDMSRI